MNLLLLSMQVISSTRSNGVDGSYSSLVPHGRRLVLLQSEIGLGMQMREVLAPAAVLVHVYELVH